MYKLHKANPLTPGQLPLFFIEGLHWVVEVPLGLEESARHGKGPLRLWLIIRPKLRKKAAKKIQKETLFSKYSRTSSKRTPLGA